MGKTIICEDLGPEKEIIETVCESNPLDPITQVWHKWGRYFVDGKIPIAPGLLLDFSLDTSIAISKCMAIINRED